MMAAAPAGAATTLAGPGTVVVMFKWLFDRIERIIDWAARREVRKREEPPEVRGRY